MHANSFAPNAATTTTTTITTHIHTFSPFFLLYSLEFMCVRHNEFVYMHYYELTLYLLLLLLLLSLL